jgi:hypothetical protein
LESEARAEAQLIDDVLWFNNHGSMPDAGGRLDQDPRWVAAVPIVNAEIEIARKVKQHGP